jgi:EAL domain-containing protein (putative c-di-GMP-specific phosphodiesterase class I)
MEFTHKIKELIAETKGKIFQIQELDINIHITAGISKGSSDDIIENADLSLKTARATKADFIIYNSELKTSKEYQNNLIWTSKIKKAVTEDRVVAFFQPIYDYKLNKITKVESLVRIIDEDGTIVSPFFFLNIAKKSKLYFHITKIMFEKMIIKMKEYPELNFSINISSDDIMNSDVKEFIIKTIESNNIGSRVIFEIVESEGIESFEEMEHFINWIKSVGGQLAIDDFGSGYSNFSYLMKLESNFIKIDGSMISQLIEGKNSLSVVETIVNFAKKNNILTIAEFVSSKELFDMVRLLGIDFAQGYYINKPSDIIDLKPKFK